MTRNDHELSAPLFCQEAIQSGITTFVDNAAGYEPGLQLRKELREARFKAYDTSGIRVIYAQELVDDEFDDDPYFEHFLETFRNKYPSLNIPPTVPMETDAVLSNIESLIQNRHGDADGRLHVWPAPLFPWSVSSEGLRQAYNLAERHDAMVSTHISEVEQQERYLVSSVEYLNNNGTVQLSEFEK